MSVLSEREKTVADSIEKVAIIGGKTATYGGAISAVVSGLTISEIGVIVGIIVGVVGLLLGQCWQWRKDRREERALTAWLENEAGGETVL